MLRIATLGTDTDNFLMLSVTGDILVYDQAYVCCIAIDAIHKTNNYKLLRGHFSVCSIRNIKHCTIPIACDKLWIRRQLTDNGLADMYIHILISHPICQLFTCQKLHTISMVV